MSQRAVISKAQHQDQDTADLVCALPASFMDPESLVQILSRTAKLAGQTWVSLT